MVEREKDPVLILIFWAGWPKKVPAGRLIGWKAGAAFCAGTALIGSGRTGATLVG